MRHCILVKFNEAVTDKTALCAEIERFWAKSTAEMAEVESVVCRRNVVARPNRYDLLIRLEIAPEKLAAYDASAQHAAWKAQYGKLLAQKAIFDYEA
ncbi:MAG: Dabb family protein [Faecalibacterium sp.]|jgi:hypothetical protein|nr:Dabb family protein [Faecalibacterium sp.]